MERGKVNAHQATKKLDPSEKGRHPVTTPGGEQRVICVSESGLYKMTLRSDKPEAKVFQDWVTKVLGLACKPMRN